MTTPRPDQASRPNIPLSPGGVSVAQMLANGLLTNADMIALGLMLDTTGQAIHTAAASTSTNTGTALTQGVPPAVQNAAGYSRVQVDESGSPYTFHTFAADSRIWGVHLSLALYKNSSATAPTQAYGSVTAGGIVLTVAECAVSGANSNDSDDCDLAFPGIQVNAGDTLILDVNGGTGVTNGGIRASCVVVASTP